MNRQEQQKTLQQLETVIEHSYRLQLELLGLLRSMMEIEPSTPRSSLPETHDAPDDIELPDKPTFSVTEAAAILGVSRDTVYQCVSTGEIPALRLGRRLLIPRAALARMLRGSQGSSSTGK